MSGDTIRALTFTALGAFWGAAICALLYLT